MGRILGGLFFLVSASAAFLAPRPSRLFSLHLAALALLWVAALILAFRRPRALNGATILSVAILSRLVFCFWPSVSEDVARYLWDGTVVLHGRDPYRLAPADPSLASLRAKFSGGRVEHENLPSVYPPLAQGTFAAAAGLGLGPRGWRDFVLLLDCAVVCALAFWLKRASLPQAWLVFYAWCPAVLLGAAEGHVDALMLLFLVFCGIAWEKRHGVRAGLFLGAALLSKVVAVLLLPYLLLRRPRAILLGAVPLVVLGCLPFRNGVGPGLATLLRFGRDYTFNASLYGVAARLAPPAAHLLVAVALALFLAWVAWKAKDFASAAALSFFGLLALSPTVHIWYLTWFLCMLPLLGRRRMAIPMLAWGASVLCVWETYRFHAAGGPWREFPALEWAEYAVVLVALAFAAGPFRTASPALRSRNGDVP